MILARANRPFRIPRIVPVVIVPVAVVIGKATLFAGDCREVLKTLADNSIDSIVTDPPYALVSIVKRFGAANAAPAKGNAAYIRASTGFMGKQWDNGDTAHDPDFWAECLRVLKPGGHLLAFGGTRTYQRLGVAIEDGGFEIRDMLLWLYGSGFPKSHDVSKGIDRAAGAKGSFGAEKTNFHSRGDHVSHEGWKRPWMDDPEAVNNSGREYLPATDSAIQWQGWGTALKPAQEPICLARKPLSEPTVAANVLRWGTGAINVDGCRVALDGDYKSKPNGRPSQTGLGDFYDPNRANKPDTVGRWPANVITDGSDEVVGMFPQAKGAVSNGKSGQYGIAHEGYGGMQQAPSYGDSGSAARFFYAAKANAKDRAGSKHPTVKPVSLIRYLCRLITPPGGVVLDPFAGSGTTGEAAHLEGFKAIMVEREAEYISDIKSRMSGLGVEVDDGG